MSNIWKSLYNDVVQQNILSIRSNLVMTISFVTRERKLDDFSAAELLGIDVESYNDMKSGNIKLFGIEQLMIFLIKLGYEYQVDFTKDLNNPSILSIIKEEHETV